MEKTVYQHAVDNASRADALPLPPQDIMGVPSVASVCPPNECETFESQQVASDCMWSDPAKDEQVQNTITWVVVHMYVALAPSTVLQKGGGFSST